MGRAWARKCREVGGQFAAPLQHGAVPLQRKPRRMKSVAWQVQSIFKRGRPAGLNELQIAILRRAVDFVTDHGMAGVRGVNPDLVGAAGEGLRLDE